MSPRHSLVTFASLATFAVLVAGAAPALHAQGDSAGGKGRGSARVAGKGALATGAVSATCNDGSTFRGDSRSGACSGHGGVKKWSDGSDAPRPKGATAQCNDGSWYAKPGRKGACAGHGGVKQWVKG